MSDNKRYTLREISAEDLPGLLIKAARIAQNVENITTFENEYHDSFVESKLSGRLAPDCIAILGKSLYDLTIEQNKISKSICEAFEGLKELNGELSPERHEYVVGLSSEIVKVYLRIEVLCELLKDVCHNSAKDLVINHTTSGIELNLDTNPNRN